MLFYPLSKRCAIREHRLSRAGSTVFDLSSAAAGRRHRANEPSEPAGPTSETGSGESFITTPETGRERLQARPEQLCPFDTACGDGYLAARRPRPGLQRRIVVPARSGYATRPKYSIVQRQSPDGQCATAGATISATAELCSASLGRRLSSTAATAADSHVLALSIPDRHFVEPMSRIVSSRCGHFPGG